MYLFHQQVLHMQSPLGIDQTPYFSWMLQSEQENTVQETYRIHVHDPLTKQPLWDSGTVSSSRNAFISYSGDALKSRTLYEWTLSVQDNHGEQATITDTFETGLLQDEIYETKWAESPFPVKKRKKGFGNGAPGTLFRKTFEATKKVRCARLYMTSRGVYHLLVNGQAPDNRVLAPEYTSYPDYFCYQTYDITSLLVEGKNALGVMVGDGWYFGPTVTMDNKTLKQKHAILFQLFLTYEDGTEEMFSSDQNVVSSTSPVISSDLFGGEYYDARMEQTDWATAAFDDSKWSAAKLRKITENKIVAQIGEPVVPIQTIPVQEMYTSPKGEIILDFGQNIAGYVEVNLDLPEGAEMTLDLFEVTDVDGNYYNNIMSAKNVGEGVDQKIRYISNGRKASYHPYFMFSGFRYARISGIDTVQKEDFTAIALSTKKENLGTFQSSSADLNQLYSNIRWSQYANMLSIPTDCPQREKAGWTGDIGLYAKTALLNEDVTPFLTRWLENVTVDQASNGAVPMVVPFNTTYQSLTGLLKLAGKSLSEFGVAGWGDAAVLVPYAMYELTGNTAILERQYSSMKKWCDYIIHAAKRRGDKTIPKEDERLLWNTGFHYGEWLIPSTMSDGMTGKDAVKAMRETPKYIAPVFGWNSICLFAQICKVLGRDSDFRNYKHVSDQMLQVIQKYLLLKDNQIPWSYMGAYVIILHFKLVDGELKERYLQGLIQMLQENHMRLDTGFLATPFLLEVLSENGYDDLAYEILFQTEAPSWLYEVKHGATTIWESWIGYEKDGNPAKISMNHYSFGAVAEWMFRHINGIRSEGIGFRDILIEPALCDKLTFATRTYLTENGIVSSSWRVDDNNFLLDVEIPCNAKATVKLPNGESYRVGSGKYSYHCKL